MDRQGKRHRSNRGLALLGAAAALSAVSLAPPTGALAGPSLTVTVGGLPPVSLGSGATGGSGASGASGGSGASGSSGAAGSGIGVSVLPESNGGQQPVLVEAKAGETPVLSVPLPSVPTTGASETPAAKLPEATPPSTPGTPVVGGGSSGGGSPGGGSSGGGSSPGGSSAVGASGSSASPSANATAASSSGATVTGGSPRPHSARGAQGAARRTRRSSRAAAAGSGGSSPTARGKAVTGTATTAAPVRATTTTASGSEGHGGPLASLGRDLPLPLPVPDWSKPIIALLLLLVLALAVRWGLVSRRARSLEASRRTLLRDLDLLQAALVPEVPSTIGGLDVSVAYSPADGPAAGGDFYDVFSLDEHRVAVILGDVTGHGHEALQRAAQTRYTLRAHLVEEPFPRRALARTSLALAEPGFEQLATVAVAIFDRRSSTLTFALAGHPPPLVLGAEAPESPLACSSPPVGWDVPTGLRQRTITLPAGARVCLFSDGLTEARCAPGPSTRGRDRPRAGRLALLGRERLLELIESLPARGGAPELLDAVRAKAVTTPDDMAACILTAREHGRRRRVDLEELELGPVALERGLFASFLAGLGLGNGERERLLAALGKRLQIAETATVLVDRSAAATRVRLVPASADSGAREGPAADISSFPAAARA